MNKDKGQYQLTHIFDKFLVSPGSKSPGKQSGNSAVTIHLALFPVLIASYSSSVEKDGSLH